jgi:hypothetical protein
MPLDDKQWSALARDLRRVAARAAPGWTDSGSHDPGVTVLELLAFVLADLHHRTSAPSPHVRGLAQEVALHAAALATTTAAHADDEGGGLRRVSYFAGQLLGVDDFQAEQDYLLDRLSRRNRLLHGAGIVDGLAVTVDPGAGAPAVVIAPGLAFDPRGREICVDAPCRLPLPASIAALLVQLTYREQPCRDVVALAGAPPDATAGNDATRPSRVVETFAATLAAAPAADAVTLARLHRVRGRWRVDAKLKPLRVRR